MEKITDESIKAKYGKEEFEDMIDAFEEEASDAKQMEAGYWSEEDDVAVLEDMGFTKEEARYLVYDEQPQDEEEYRAKEKLGLEPYDIKSNDLFMFKTIDSAVMIVFGDSIRGNIDLLEEFEKTLLELSRKARIEGMG